MDEDFKLTKINKLMIIITIIISIGFIISLISLIFSLSDKPAPIPELYIEKGKTSTLVATTTAEETTTTESTTTTRTLKSPYYDVDVNKIASEEIFTKQDLNKEEATKILEYYYNLANSIFNVNDYSFLDIKTTVEYAKKGEKDVIINKEKKYGLVYNANKLFEKIFSKSVIYDIRSLNYNKENLYIYDDKTDVYYRISNIDLNKNLEIVELKLTTLAKEKIEGEIRFYDANYKEAGFTAPQYQKNKIVLRYEDNRWVIREYKYPFYE